MPPAAGPALLSLYVLLGTVPALSLMMSGYFLNTGRDELLEHLGADVGGAGFLMLLTIFGLRRGDLWGIRLFRSLAWCLIGLVAVNLVAALMLSASIVGPSLPGARGTGEFTMIATLACLVAVVILIRGMQRIRWLDPHSLPHEWEKSTFRGGSR
ncbi:MAG: hypothetical protein ACRYG8_24345 [Janthinobacterium lividum]